MGPFATWMFRRTVRREVFQGAHEARIIQMYREIHDAAHREFTEDNEATLHGFLRDCFEAALREGNDGH